jgi:hypothetical protein
MPLVHAGREKKAGGGCSPERTCLPDNTGKYTGK